MGAPIRVRKISGVSGQSGRRGFKFKDKQGCDHIVGQERPSCPESPPDGAAYRSTSLTSATFSSRRTTMRSMAVCGYIAGHDHNGQADNSKKG